MASRRGLAFTAWLGRAAQSEPRTVLIEVQENDLRVSRTGGDAWSVSSSGEDGTAAAAAATVQTCNKWDAKGRNPAMNVYIDIDAYRNGSSASPRAVSSSGGGNGGGSSTGQDEEDEEGPSRCKLGHLVQHCLPQLAARLGGYSQLALFWCTWLVEEKSSRPLPGTISAVGTQDPAHWRLLRQLAKEKEAGAGVRSDSPPPPDEEAALRRAKETLVEAAAYFGPEAVAKCASLTVRKLYQREYHFFSPSGEDVADSRRHALEWAAGLAAVNDMLERCPEVRAKISERLTGPGAGGGSRARKRPRQQLTSGSGGGRRVVLAVGQGTAPLGAAEAAGTAGNALAATPGNAAGGPGDAQPGLLQLPALSLGGLEALPQLAVLPPPGPAPLPPPAPAPLPPLMLLPSPAQVDQQAAMAPLAQPNAAVAQEHQPGQLPAEPEAAGSGPAASLRFTEWLQAQMAAEPSCSFGLSLLRPLRRDANGITAEVQQRSPGNELQSQAAAPGEQVQPSSPQPPPASPSPRCAHCSRPQEAGAAVAAVDEVVPIDAVLHAWQEHDAVRRELASTQRQLAAVTQERDSLRLHLNAALAQLQGRASRQPQSAAASTL